MLFDWFTVVAQITNFLVLVWLLKRFLYGPILHAMAEREKRIQNTIESANAQKTEAERERAEFQQKNAAFDREKQSLAAQARQIANEEKFRLVEAARTEAETLRSKWHESLAGEQAAFRKGLAQAQGRKLSGSLGRRSRTSLARNSTTALPRSLSSGSKTWTATSAGTPCSARREAAAPVIVRSSTPLPPHTRQRIEAVLSETLGVKPAVQFETSGALGTGIELWLNGYKIAWTLSDYLDAIQKSAAGTDRQGGGNDGWKHSLTTACSLFWTEHSAVCAGRAQAQAPAGRPRDRCGADCRQRNRESLGSAKRRLPGIGAVSRRSPRNRIQHR